MEKSIHDSVPCGSAGKKFISAYHDFEGPQKLIIITLMTIITIMIMVLVASSQTRELNE